jgi:hypothetical protein
LSTTPNGKDQLCIAAERFTEDAANSLLEDTFRTPFSILLQRPCRRGNSDLLNVPDLGHVQLASSPFQSTTAAGARRRHSRE